MASRRHRDPFLPPSLRRLGRRQGERPRIDPRFPCLQQEQTSPPELVRELIAAAASMPHVRPVHTHLLDCGIPGTALVLEDEAAMGQPEAFIAGTAFAVVRPEGSVELRLKPEWAERALVRGWLTVHPLVRYMAGALPPQSTIAYAPRDARELQVVLRLIDAARCYAEGRIGGMPLPDSRW